MTLDITTISVLIGIIGGIVGIIGQLSNMRKQQDEMLKAQAVRDKDTDDRLRRIEERLDSHNSYASKFAGLTETIIEMKNDIKWIKETK